MVDMVYLRAQNRHMMILIVGLLTLFPLAGEIWAGDGSSASTYLPDSACVERDRPHQLSTAIVTPGNCYVLHNANSVSLSVSTAGAMGQLAGAGLSEFHYCFPDLYDDRGSDYPRGSDIMLLPAIGVWVGAIVGNDTLVSNAKQWSYVSLEFFGDEMQYRSTLDPESQAYARAVSEQDFVAVYTDTNTLYADLDAVDNRPHRPLDIRITQSSFAWSYSYAEDFILIDFMIQNIGTEPLRNLYFGLTVDHDVFQDPKIQYDDNYNSIFGYLPIHETEYGGCEFQDSVNLAWYAHHSGNLLAELPAKPLPHIAGIRLLDASQADPVRISYNWWTNRWWDQALGFGPERERFIYDRFRAGEGYPRGDRAKYHALRNGEIDYDPAYAPLIGPDDPVWLYPDQEVVPYLPQRIRTEYLLSAGPFSIAPGDFTTITYAYVMGENFHRDPYNYENLVQDDNQYDPDAWYTNVNFSDIVKNSMWASWVHDNPGYDTDGNGYAGEYRLCCEDSAIVSIDTTVTPPDTTWEYDLCEKIWYKGDGVPDWRPATPPPAPKVWVEPSVGEVRIRWNGTLSETTKDIFMHIPDFEGYRVYYSLDTREDSYTLLGSYDKFNYDKYVWNSGWRDWQVLDNPYTHQELLCLYGDSCSDPLFDPLLYSRSNPYRMQNFPDSIFFFKEHDFNQSEFGLTTPIEKVYPDQPYPTSIIPDSAEAWELTEEGYLKYFEYELTIDNLLSTVPYYFNVTAFDFGSPESGLDVLETSKTLNPIRAFASPDAGDVDEQNLEVYIYPNPYRIDGGYRADGFEGRDARWPIPDRMRMIHFANLPAKCWIRIYSLDGDLIREIRHDMDPADPDASHDTWDMITRNTMRPVSGIYYWTVEDDYGDVQIGKLVILK